MNLFSLVFFKNLRFCRLHGRPGNKKQLYRIAATIVRQHVTVTVRVGLPSSIGVSCAEQRSRGGRRWRGPSLQLATPVRAGPAPSFGTPVALSEVYRMPDRHHGDMAAAGVTLALWLWRYVPCCQHHSIHASSSCPRLPEARSSCLGMQARPTCLPFLTFANLP